MEPSDSSFDLVVAGFGPILMDIVGPLLKGLKVLLIRTGEELEALVDNYEANSGLKALVSAEVNCLSQLEVAQLLSSSFTGAEIVFVTLEKSQFNVKELKKNGFTDCYLLPTDSQYLTDFITNVRARTSGGSIRRFKSVKVIDIQPGVDLPFELMTYLPLNNKYVVLTGSGKLSDKKAALLKRQHVNSVFIDSNQIEKFYEFTADRLIAMTDVSNNSVSQTERAELLRSSVRELYHSVLDPSHGANEFTHGRDLLEQSKKVVESYVQKKTGIDLKACLESMLGEGDDSYSHAQTVSTLASLLSMGTGIGQPEDLAIAGLFHDIGITGMAELISPLETDRLSDDEKAVYFQHPRTSLNLLKEKRISVPPAVFEIIEKHHERMDGKGFPAGLAAHRIPEEAHLLAYADALEFLSRTRRGQPRLTSREIHKVISSKLSLNPEVTHKVGKFLEI